MFLELYQQTMKSKSLQDQYGNIMFPFVPMFLKEFEQIKKEFDIVNIVESNIDSFNTSDMKLMEIMSSRKTIKKSSNANTPLLHQTKSDPFK